MQKLEKDRPIMKKSFDLSLSIIGLVLFLTLFFIPRFSYTLFLYLISYFILGKSVIGSCIRAILRKDFFNENTLMVLATVGAFFLGEYAEAVGVMLFYRIGEFLQDKAVETSRGYIQDLFKLEKLQALLLKDGEWVTKDPIDIKVGETILVKKGEKIPLDGVITRGLSILNTSSLTGESLPVNVQEGDNVYSGSINEGESIEIRVSKIFENSSMQRLARLVEEATKKKAPLEKFITLFARRYTPFVFGLALLLVLIPPLFFAQDWETWGERAIICLVISCPCAFVLSPPLSFFCGLGVSSKNRILIKSGEILQLLTQLRNIVLDKTGTITQGNFALREFLSLDPQNAPEFFRIMAMMENFSSHPIAIAITSSYKNQYGAIPKGEGDIQEIPGKGLIGSIDGKKIMVGSENFFKENQISLKSQNLQTSSVRTRLYLSINGEVQASAIISDTLKPTSAKVLQELQQKFDITILSGDNFSVVQDIAQTIGLKKFYAELLPEDKVSFINKIKETGITMFIGDGLNDAPSLATANIGVAMGQKGADVTIETADVVISEDDLVKIPTMLKIAEKTISNVKQNIAIALLVKVFVLILATFSLATIWEGIFADVGVSLLTILNALRILQTKTPVTAE